MRLISRLLIVLPPVLAFLVTSSSPALAASLRLAGADDRGVTLQVDVGSYSLGKADREGRSRLLVQGLEEASLEGRPVLPFAAALIAIPPGARVVAHVIGGSNERLDENVRLAIGMKPGFRSDGGPLGTVPTLESVPPILDGPWPASAVEVTAPFTVRHQDVVTVRVWPFRYDPRTDRLWSRSTILVRLDFEGGATIASSGTAREGSFEDLLSGTVLNYQQGKRWRRPGARDRVGLESGNRHRLLAGEAFDEDEPETRVLLDSTGVWALDYDELAAKGFPAGVPDSEVSVHRHEYIQDPAPPGPSYVTIELPIEVDDRNGDGRFGSGDRILVYLKNWAERSGASFGQRAWGDGEVVYATRVRGRAGLRIPKRPGWQGLSLTPVASYPYSQRWEQNNFYMPPFQQGVTDTGNTDQFLWSLTSSGNQNYSAPDSFRFETNDLDTSHVVRLFVNWRGTLSNGHLNWAHVRNAANRITTIVDSTSWFGRGTITRSAVLFGSALSEGDRNVLRCWGRTNPCTGFDCDRVFALNDWFQATYWRRFNALAGYLPCNSAGAVGDFEIRATGFSQPTDIRVYDVSNPLAPERLDVPDSLVSASSPFSIRFQDNAAALDTVKYLVFDNPKRPASDKYTSVTRINLLQRASGDYLMIVPEAFLPAVDSLVALREAQGLSVVVATLESVNDQFNGGRKSSYAIKRFIRYAYRNWDAQFVLLVGDASEDPRHFLFSTPDWVPAQKILGPVSVSDGVSSVYEAIPSDPWYVWCVDCPNPGSQPFVHDLFIGRLPVNSLQQTQDIVDKLVRYERVLPTDAWRRQMLLLADDAYSTQSLFGGGNPGDNYYCYRNYEEIFLEINRDIRDSIMTVAGLTQPPPLVFSLGDSLAGEPMDPNSPNCRESLPGTMHSTRLTVTPKLLAHLNSGVVWWNFQGHANPHVLTHEDLYVNRGSEDDKDKLVNDGKPFLFSAFSCHPNFFSSIDEARADFGPSLGEDMVMLPRAGAIASWGSSGFEIIPFNATTHLNVHFARALFWHSAFDNQHGTYWNGDVQIGEAAARAVLDNVTTGVGNPSSLERDVGISYNLLGDPGTVLSIGASQITVKANGVDVIDGQPVRLVTLADTLRLEADIASNTRIATLALERTDGTGTTVIPPAEYTLTPAFPDTERAGSAGRRYHLTYFTQLGQGAYHYTIRVTDVVGVPTKFDVVFRFLTVLKADGATLTNGDPVKPDAQLELLVISPRPVVDPQTAFALSINGTSVPFTATHAPNDPSGREWILTWTHTPYAVGDYRVDLVVEGQFTFTSSFRVETRTALQNVFAFPNPFDEQLGTHFSFTLEGDAAANVLIRVYTVSGKLIYERTEHTMLPGYHQIAWDGNDAEGSAIANGVYLYRLVARTPQASVFKEGRLVKLRKPVHKTEVPE